MNKINQGHSERKFFILRHNLFHLITSFHSTWNIKPSVTVMTVWIYMPLTLTSYSLPLKLFEAMLSWVRLSRLILTSRKSLRLYKTRTSSLVLYNVSLFLAGLSSYICAVPLVLSITCLIGPVYLVHFQRLLWEISPDDPEAIW